MIIEYIALYILILLISGNIIFAWYETPLGINALSRLTSTESDTISYESLCEKLYDYSPFWGELLACPICFGTWITFMVGIMASLFCSYIDFKLVLACALSIPTLVNKLYLK
jgi:hypothetical protein